MRYVKRGATVQGAGVGGQQWYREGAVVRGARVRGAGVWGARVWGAGVDP